MFETLVINGLQCITYANGNLLVVRFVLKRNLMLRLCKNVRRQRRNSVLHSRTYGDLCFSGCWKSDKRDINGVVSSARSKWVDPSRGSRHPAVDTNVGLTMMIMMMLMVVVIIDYEYWWYRYFQIHPQKLWSVVKWKITLPYWCKQFFSFVKPVVEYVLLYCIYSTVKC